MPKRNLQIDKSSWGPGPWQYEPDQLYWQDEATGLWCEVVRAALGHFCGYVMVPKEHPAFSKRDDELDLEVHGGVTYTGMDEDRQEWRIGFDCAHYFDFIPKVQTIGTYRTMRYVVEEVTRLANQLAKLSNEVPKMPDYGPPIINTAPYYAMIIRDTSYMLVGPFSAKEEAEAWASREVPGPYPTPNWNVLQLDNPHQVIVVTPAEVTLP